MAKEYNFSKTSGQCAACQNTMVCDQEFMATIREQDEEILREDYCLPCWQANPQDARPGVLAVWHSHVHKPEEKKKLFVDDELLINFFQRLEGSDQASKINFRFVLALVLMRKRLLVYDRMEKKPDGLEVWQMHFKGNDQSHEVIDPHMDEEKIAEASGSLGQILEGQL
jgi:hypothetical protein